MTKYTLTLLVMSLATLSCSGSKISPIALPAPDLKKLASTGEAFQNRQSIRDFLTDDLSLQQISNLLWAANGINRPESNKRTAPSSHNSQEIDLYVIMAKGAYCYDAAKHQLVPVAEGDFRGQVAGTHQKEMAKAPVCLVIVADLRKLGEGNGSERDLRTAHTDAGIVSQNINIFCAAAGLATVTRSSMEHENLAKTLNLDPLQRVILNNPVGLPAK